jgi:hypothetical protein
MMAERNAALPEAKRILYRVGVNLGDILIEGDDILGDGVNVAARLEGICEPGAICLSEDAYRQARGRIEAEFADLGEQELKNIAKPVRVYRVTPEAIAAARAEVPTIPPAPRRAVTSVATPKARLLQRWPALAGALALALLAAGAFAWRDGYAPRLLGTSVAEDKLATAPRLSIVVLPFENLSSDKEQDYFADGITDDLTTDLSNIPESFVIAHSTALTFKRTPVDAKTIGRDLGVRHALEGSVRRVGETIRRLGPSTASGSRTPARIACQRARKSGVSRSSSAHSASSISDAGSSSAATVAAMRNLAGRRFSATSRYHESALWIAGSSQILSLARSLIGPAP